MRVNQGWKHIQIYPWPLSQEVRNISGDVITYKILNIFVNFLVDGVAIINIFIISMDWMAILQQLRLMFNVYF